MIELIVGTYGMLCWLLFVKFKLIPVTTYTIVTAVLGGVVILALLFITLSVFHPVSHDGRMYAPVVQVVPQVRGTVVEVPVEANQPCKTGDVLFRIDPRTYKATLEQARADLGRAQAALGKADLDVRRFTPLVKEGAVSQQELDNAIQLQLSARAGIEGARAALEKAQLDLSFSEIRSPIPGIAGVAQAQLGDLVGPGDPNPLTNVSQVDPIRVSFPLSEREYLRFANALRAAAIAAGRSPRARSR